VRHRPPGRTLLAIFSFPLCRVPFRSHFLSGPFRSHFLSGSPFPAVTEHDPPQPHKEGEEEHRRKLLAMRGREKRVTWDCVVPKVPSSVSAVHSVVSLMWHLGPRGSIFTVLTVG